MLGDEPDWLVCSHPVEPIEAREVHRAGIAPERAFSAQIEIDIEVAHRELAKRAINRLPITAAGKIRFCYRAPMSAHFENGHDVIGIVLGFQIEDQRRKTENAQGGRGEDSAFETGSGAISQNFFWRAGGVAKVVSQLVEKSLHTGRRLQRTQLSQLRACEPKVRFGRRRSFRRARGFV